MTLYGEGSDTVQPAHALGDSIDLLSNPETIKRVLSHYGDSTWYFEDNVQVEAVKPLKTNVVCIRVGSGMTLSL